MTKSIAISFYLWNFEEFINWSFGQKDNSCCVATYLMLSHSQGYFLLFWVKLLSVADKWHIPTYGIVVTHCDDDRGLVLFKWQPRRLSIQSACSVLAALLLLVLLEPLLCCCSPDQYCYPDRSTPPSVTALRLVMVSEALAALNPAVIDKKEVCTGISVSYALLGKLSGIKLDYQWYYSLTQ